MAQKGTYHEELESELKQTDPNSHASRLIAQEIDRLTKGDDEKKGRTSTSSFIDIHTSRPQKVSLKVRIPAKEYPRHNFVGKLIGPKGMTLRNLQDQTGCKMAVMGRGSMKEKDKEEELRKSGGKYSHLNDELHVLVECYSEVADAYYRISGALTELKKYFIPEPSEDVYGERDAEYGVGDGAQRGRGAYRGAPPDRSGRGGFRGRGNGPVPPQAARGAPPSRSTRGAPRGVPAGRGARGRGAAPPPPPSYDGYNTQAYPPAYGSGYEAYDDGYGAETAYYDYPVQTNAASAYDSYAAGAGYDYGDGWGGGGGKSAPASRGASRGQVRSHPYSRAATSSY